VFLYFEHMALDGESLLVYDGNNLLLRTITGTLSKQGLDADLLTSRLTSASSAAGNTETLPMKISVLPVKLQIVMTQGAVQSGLDLQICPTNVQLSSHTTFDRSWQQLPTTIRIRCICLTFQLRAFILSSNIFGEFAGRKLVGR